MREAATLRPVSFLGSIPGVAIVLVILLLIFAAGHPRFATIGNLENILSQSTMLLLIALPMTLIIMTEGVDLSIGGVMTLSSLVFAILVISTGSFPLALLAAVACGTAFGLANGLLSGIINLPPFVVTLGTLGIAQGASLLVSNGESVVGMSRDIRRIYSGDVFGIPNPVIIAALAYGLFHILLYRTRFGVYVKALGGNRASLDLAGVKSSHFIVYVYALGGAMAGIAGMLMTARLNSGHPTAAIGFEFDAIAAVALGGTSFEKGKGWIFGTLLGVLAVGVLRNGLNLLAVPSSIQVACIGLLVILALLIDSFRSNNQ